MDGSFGIRDAALYADHQKVYPRSVRGPIRRIKWAVLGLCLAVYYLLPWLRWDRGAGAPNQAVLLDIQNARLFFFWIELWPQEVYYLTGLLVLGAVGLFAVSSLYGRLWCGFACPQTVWTDLFMQVERWIQGDRTQRMRLDAAPWTARKFGQKAATHAAWITIALLTGGAWIFYFGDAPRTLVDIVTGQASLTIYGFIALFAGTTYLLAGFAREQVCTYMCPWPRFQAAMLDEHSMIVAYRGWRGEPRGKARIEGTGDCVDCRACVHVCPTGIDIREGTQLQCIGCGLCIDACDDIMQRLGRPTKLIAFDSSDNLDASGAAVCAMPAGAVRHAPGMAARAPRRLLRPRTMVYASVFSAVALVMVVAFALRHDVTLTALRDRAPLYVRLADGGIRNTYTLRIGEKGRAPVSYALALDAPANLRLSVAGQPAVDAAGHPLLAARADGIAEWRVFVVAPPGVSLGASTPVSFRLLDASGRQVAREGSIFVAPGG